MSFRFVARCITVGSLLLIAPPKANAWFFIFPIPNLAKPPALQTTIDALEKSTETRALAFVSEDKTFGAKYWAWGSYSGEVTQEEADRFALERCGNSLRTAKAQATGGQPLYDFGAKSCELHPFTPNDGPKIAEARKKAAEEARKQAAAEEEKRIAAAEEARKLATAEEAKRLAAEEEAKLIAAAEAEARQQEEAKLKASKNGSKKLGGTQARSASSIDFNAEARKSALILGCSVRDLKVNGLDGKKIVYFVTCSGGGSLTLACDPAGLCLKK